MSNDCWLPSLELYVDYNSDWNKYEDAVYTIFKGDIIDNPPSFEGKNIKIRWHPIEYNKPEAFFHVTCQDYIKNGERVPDFRRCERIRWIRAFIENYKCDSTLCDDCEGIKVWREKVKSNERVHLLLEEELYLVVLEPRREYCLLITAFYLEYDHALKKKLEHYKKYIEQQL
ncbi:hypothetical protein [Chakrabartyella piscis]|uniref:hypothetical protein n=1 Tax=Chakrabartyella piscis TaxID=2918914 RepID=UPI002958C84D|nr:hypothetical protein [Chakrabartyella piscis]